MIGWKVAHQTGQAEAFLSNFPTHGLFKAEKVVIFDLWKSEPNPLGQFEDVFDIVSGSTSAFNNLNEIIVCVIPGWDLEYEK